MSKLERATESIEERLARRRIEIEQRLPGITELALIVKEKFGYCQIGPVENSIPVSPIQPRNIPRWTKRRSNG